MKRILLFPVLLLASCGLTPEQQDRIFRIGERVADRAVDKAFGPEKPVNPQK